MMNDFIPPTPPSRKNKKHNRKPKPLPENCWVDQPENLPEFSRKVELSRGLFAIVDEEDFEFLDKFSWSVKPDGGTCYAVTNASGEYKMHRLVMKVNKSDGVTIDHINHNGLDNRKCNLRVVSRSENQYNRRERTKKKNRFIGVLPALSGGFVTCFTIPGGNYTKKNFNNEVEAARYYDYLAVKHKGPDTKTNLSRGRFTQEELDSFSGKISNPLEETEIVADIKYQKDMICLTSIEFQKTIHKIAEKDSRIALLEQHIAVIEAELSRLEGKRNL